MNVVVADRHADVRASAALTNDDNDDDADDGDFDDTLRDSPRNPRRFIHGHTFS